MAGQRFDVVLQITTECEEDVTVDDVREWVRKKFDGCDLGTVKIYEVAEH